MNEAVREQIAMTDDAALEACLDGTLTDGEAWEFLADAVAKRKLFPVFGGSALTGEGVEALLGGLDLLCRTEYNADGPLEVLAYQIRHDRQGGRVVYGKVLSGTLRPRQMLHGEKVNELRRYLGEKWTPLPSASAGELAALTGLRAIRAGDRAGETRGMSSRRWPCRLCWQRFTAARRRRRSGSWNASGSWKTRNRLCRSAGMRRCSSCRLP